MGKFSNKIVDRKDKVEIAHLLLKEDKSIKDLMETFKVARRTIFKYRTKAMKGLPIHEKNGRPFIIDSEGGVVIAEYWNSKQTKDINDPELMKLAIEQAKATRQRRRLPGSEEVEMPDFKVSISTLARVISKYKNLSISSSTL